MLAKEIMHRHVVTARPEMTVGEAAKLFMDRHISGAPVVDAQKFLVGVVSQTDLVRHDREGTNGHEIYSWGLKRTPLNEDLPKGFHEEEPDMTRVQDVMTPIVVSAPETATLRQLGRMMVRRHVHRVVITRGGKVAGIVTSLDLIRGLIRKV